VHARLISPVQVSASGRISQLTDQHRTVVCLKTERSDDDESQAMHEQREQVKGNEVTAVKTDQTNSHKRTLLLIRIVMIMTLCLVMCACVTFNFSPLFRAAADRTQIGYTKFLFLASCVSVLGPWIGIFYFLVSAGGVGAESARASTARLRRLPSDTALVSHSPVSHARRQTHTCMQPTDVKPSQQTSRGGVALLAEEFCSAEKN
jgi:hypothetical protein